MFDNSQMMTLEKSEKNTKRFVSILKQYVSHNKQSTVIMHTHPFNVSRRNMSMDVA